MYAFLGGLRNPIDRGLSLTPTEISEYISRLGVQPANRGPTNQVSKWKYQTKCQKISDFRTVPVTNLKEWDNLINLSGLQ